LYVKINRVTYEQFTNDLTLDLHFLWTSFCISKFKLLRKCRKMLADRMTNERSFRDLGLHW